MWVHPDIYDVLVVGGGHAGIEACLAAARMGCTTLLVTMNPDSLGLMSCNPAVGGIGKGQLVKEIDALGGEMARAVDVTAIQYRQLNTKKGSAVRSSRAQVDRLAYTQYMRGVIERQDRLQVRQASVASMHMSAGHLAGIQTTLGEIYRATCVILTPGTFLDGLIHIGFNHFPGGRFADLSAHELAQNLRQMGFRVGRFKTGTCPRLDSRSVDLSRLQSQDGDILPQRFSYEPDTQPRNQIKCYITHTTKKTHQIIRDNLDRSPLFTGVIKGTGVRYCPSIEDKVVRFPSREAHQVFLEPEGENTYELYPNGLSTSLPIDIQLSLIHSVPGMEKAHIIRPGYGIEHDYVDPTELHATLETKRIENLFFAGQINGTTGYEEAAAQGLLAGINAALKVQKRPPLIVSRSDAYLGVLVDDLVTKGTGEPYRMFTSRVEYRLLLREDNANQRLASVAHKLDLIDDSRYHKILRETEDIKTDLRRLKTMRLFPNQTINDKLDELGSSKLHKPHTLQELLRRPELSYENLVKLVPDFAMPSHTTRRMVEIETKYEGYITRQKQEVARFEQMEKIRITDSLDYQKVPGLSREAREKLSKIRPSSLGQASRISGITPAALLVLLRYIRAQKQGQNNEP